MRNILVIDDDERLRDLVAEYLGSRGFAVHTAEDGPVGLQQVQNRTDLDIVILDVMMPGMDGLEVCREIRRNSRIPVIMLTARGDDTDRIVETLRVVYEEIDLDLGAHLCPVSRAGRQTSLRGLQ